MEWEGEYLRRARRKNVESRGYFDDDDEIESPPRSQHGSAARGLSNGGSAAPSGPAEAEEIDPLDAFMAGITAQVKQEQAGSQTAKRPAEKPLRFQDDDDDTAMPGLPRSQKKPRGGVDAFADSDEEVYATAKQLDGDSDGDNDDAKKEIEALAPLRHSEIEYETFRKQFYTPHAAVAALSDAQVRELRAELGVATDGSDVPRPIRSFVEVGVDRTMLGVLMKLGLEAPTPIQAQAFPIALSGRDMIGIAKTGSGKTLAFTLPMVVHVMDQRELRKDEGPIAIVLSPTRELAHQIVGQAKKFLTVYGANCAAIYGGVGKWDQIQALRKGAEVVVATPGRLIDMIRKKNVKTRRVTFVVLDEADRMFEMGFEPQLRSIMGQIRPDRQTLMFSATFRKRVEMLARDVLHDPVKVTIGQIGQANEDIHQIAVVLANHNAKWPWLMANLKRIADEGRVLIFAGSKTGCEEMTKNLNTLHYQSNCLHGDKNQQERNEALAQFRSGACSILVATDVASRGLDVKDVKTVINYDVAKNIDTHVHRIGRTGRMGAEGFEPGTAYTLVTKHDAQFAAQLVYNMDVSGQAVAPDLIALARRDPRFRRGTPANGGHAVAPPSVSTQQSGGEATFDPIDEEDAIEMKRWSESQKKSKADQRRGLGFAGGVGSNGGVRMSFVKSSSAGSVQQAFNMGFVKSSAPSAALAPPPPPVAPMQAPPPPAFAPPTMPASVSMPPPGLRPPPPPPAFIQHAPLPPHVAQFQAVPKGAVAVPTPPSAPTNVPPTLQQVVSSSSAPSSHHDQRVGSRGDGRPSRDRRRSRSRSSSRSRDRRYDRRSRSRERGSSRRYRSRSRSSRRYRSRSRSRSRSRGRSYRR